MAVTQQFADAGSLRPVVLAALGAGRDVTDVERLLGGSKKGAYRVRVDDGVTVLVYVWNAAEDYGQGVAQAEIFEQWLRQLVDGYGDLLIPITERIAQAWGRLNVPDPLPVVDGRMAGRPPWPMTGRWSRATLAT